uniref:(northern house mosquito) hypothetical protein n=1 Tax=Culex pipiens TaxID=7175 RepID=A0A8D8F281_CULPI
MCEVTITSTVFRSIPAMASAVVANLFPIWLNRPTIGLWPPLFCCGLNRDVVRWVGARVVVCRTTTGLWVVVGWVCCTTTGGLCVVLVVTGVSSSPNRFESGPAVGCESVAGIDVGGSEPPPASSPLSPPELLALVVEVEEEVDEEGSTLLLGVVGTGGVLMVVVLVLVVGVVVVVVVVVEEVVVVEVIGATGCVNCADANWVGRCSGTGGCAVVVDRINVCSRIWD